MRFTSVIPERHRLDLRPVDVEKRKLDGAVSTRDHGWLLVSSRRCIAWLVTSGSQRERPRNGGVEQVARAELWLTRRGSSWVICARGGENGEIAGMTAHASLPVVVEDAHVAWVDLDLDLEMESSRGIELRDVGDFMARISEPGYPADVVEAAWAGIDEVMRRHARGAWPFDGMLDGLLTSGARALELRIGIPVE